VRKLVGFVIAGMLIAGFVVARLVNFLHSVQSLLHPLGPLRRLNLLQRELL